MEDTRFRVHVLSATENPQQLVWLGMHQDYFEGCVADSVIPSEERAGQICVKRLLAGERGHYGCYSADTEVLTASGWVAWPNVNASMALAAVNAETGSISFERPSRLQRVPVRQGDKLYCLQSQRLDIAVTQDHRMVVSHRRKNNTWSSWYFTSAASAVGKAVRYRLGGKLQDRHIPNDCPEDVDLVQLFKLAGFFFGDGCRSSRKRPSGLRFSLRRVRKIAYLRSCGFAVEEQVRDRFTVKHAQVAQWVHKHFANEQGKVIPAFVMHLPAGLFEAFADGLRNSDGTSKHLSWAFDSTQKESLDILQAAFHLNGQAASLSLNNPNEGVGHENHLPCWRLHISSRAPFARAEVNQRGRTRGTEQLIPYQGEVYCATVSTGALLVRRNGKPVVCGNCLEHPAITFAVGGFPHSVMQQARTHRIGVSFDVQSMRYTGQRMLKVVSGELRVEDVVYFRQPGYYKDREGKKYRYSIDDMIQDQVVAKDLIRRYAARLRAGFAEEHIRGMLPFDFRQNFVVSFNLRSALHFLDLRAKADAQPEIQALCDLMLPHLEDWAPEILAYYVERRLGKARLAP